MRLVDHVGPGTIHGFMDRLRKGWFQGLRTAVHGLSRIHGLHIIYIPALPSYIFTSNCLIHQTYNPATKYVSIQHSDIVTAAYPPVHV